MKNNQQSQKAQGQVQNNSSNIGGFIGQVRPIQNQQQIPIPNIQNGLNNNVGHFKEEQLEQNPQSCLNTISNKKEEEKQKNQHQVTDKELEPFSDLSIQTLKKQILKYKLHYDPYYTRIYGLAYDNEYLKNANDNFEIAFKTMIENLKRNDRLKRWYEMEIKEFHTCYGIPAVIDQRWINFTQKLSVLTIHCCLTLFHPDPHVNMTYLREQYQKQILEYINLKQDEQEQQLLEKIRNRYQLNQSAKFSFNIMIHQDMVPSQDPKLISNGEEVYKDDFPKYNILQLYTLDQKLYYQIQLKNSFDKMLLDQYIHYNTKIQHINYSDQAQLVYQNTKQNEQNLFRLKLVQKNQKKYEKLKLLLDQIEGSNKDTNSKKWTDALDVQILQNDSMHEKKDSNEKPADDDIQKN